MSFSPRSFATPMVVGAFVVMSVTGVLMFFHADVGGNSRVHQFAGMVLVAGAAVHIWLNRRALYIYFRRPLALTIMGLGAVALAASFLFPSPQHGPRPGQSADYSAHLQAAPVSLVAELAALDAATLRDRLGALGYAVTGADQSALALAYGDPQQAQLIVAALLGGQAESAR